MQHPCSMLLMHEKRTVQFRQMDQSVAQPLFILYIKLHKPVTLQRTAHWIKDLLGQAGVDTSFCVQGTFCARCSSNSRFKQGDDFGRYSMSSGLEFRYNLPVVLLPSEIFNIFLKRYSGYEEIGGQIIVKPHTAMSVLYVLPCFTSGFVRRAS